MALDKLSGAQIRQDFIDYFVKQGHTFVPSSSLVPGEDQTLLFTNAGMVQFKDIFLGIDKRPYTRATNSQKCMRVAGKHNDLEDVGRDDTHHTFFEMLGNWSFGDYYKPEAISWAWDLLTAIWKLPKERLWATCFRDDIGDIPQDNEAASIWHSQPGMLPNHILFFGRKDNFWEMAETGPCGPCSEIHFDRGPNFCDKKEIPNHTCGVNKDCQRFLELWNLVFIQYNRITATRLEPLPAKHVDTGMGLERVVSILQEANSNYKTDLLFPIIKTVQSLTHQSDQEREANLTPYRVIADHTRAAAFLIADGVVPGNTGRNYVCRMIIRRASRYGSKIGLQKPFLAKTANTLIDYYGSFYPELIRNKKTILDSLTREEQRFHRTLVSGLSKLEMLLDIQRQKGEKILTGEYAFDLYATYGLPIEITRDIVKEQNMDIDEVGFQQEMELHRDASGGSGIFSESVGEDVEVYKKLYTSLIQNGKLSSNGVVYDPYSSLMLPGEILGLLKEGKLAKRVNPNDNVEVVLPQTCFYVESGGQISDTGTICSSNHTEWKIKITDMKKPVAGIIVHIGTVINGTPKVGDQAIASVDAQRRQDIMRNHTATHILHQQLQEILGEHARQAGSLVTPDRLRFDFTHPEGLTPDQVDQIETGVNQKILGNLKLKAELKPLQVAISEGAIALFGEKYGEIVRNVKIGEPIVFSNELCGGTHVTETGDIGLFIITNESSIAAGIRRIEAITGRNAYEFAHKNIQTLRKITDLLSTNSDRVVEKIQSIINELNHTKKLYTNLQQKEIKLNFESSMEATQNISGVNFLVWQFSEVDSDNLRQMVDRFREKYPKNGIVVLASIINERPTIITAITNDLVQKGLHAGDLAKYIATYLDGSGGGKPTLAQAGGKDASKLPHALAQIQVWIKNKLNKEA